MTGRLEVRLGDRTCPILIGSGILPNLGSLLPTELAGRPAVVVTDSNLAPLCLDPVIGSLDRRCSRVDAIRVPAGEKSKSPEMALRLWEQLQELGADRTVVLVALGGGVVGDLAGFVAATWMRGVDLVQVPTTLLAQVDSSVGGKTGINLPGAKNMVGAFWQPKLVVIDPAVLSSLSDREFRSGLAEVAKYGVILDAALFATLENSVPGLLQRDPVLLSGIIRRCCELKAGIVAADERETAGLRAKLNYGHTFGHAIEASFGYGHWLHGEAVAMGMILAAELARRLGLEEGEVLKRQTDLWNRLGLPVRLEDPPVDQLIRTMKRDKKRSGDNPLLVLPEAIGTVLLHTWPGDEVVAQSFALEGLADVR